MALITEQAVRELAGFKGRSTPVTSLYLDVDGRRYPRRQDYEQQLSQMVRQAKEKANGQSVAITPDLDRIEAHVRAGFDRSHVRGLAIFSCAGDGLWKVVELPVSVRNQLVVNHTPHVRQLEFVLDEYERFAVLLVDRQRARVLVFELGALTDKSEFLDALPRQEDEGGDSDRGRPDKLRDHVDEVVHRHLKRAAQAVFALYQEKGFDHLIIGASDEIAKAVEKELHRYLRDRVAARVHVPVVASDAEICAAVLPVEEQVERAKEAALVEKLRAAAAAGTGVAGLKDTLQAVVERRVDTLVVSDGYEAPGWRCHGCDYVGKLGRTCPVCGKEMAQVDDVVEEAIEVALGQSCRVEICRGNADLDVLGRIGALLRF